MSKPITLYVQDNCPYVLRCVAALLHADLAFKVINGGHLPVFPASPTGKVPLLHWNDSFVFESGVICDLIRDSRNPAAGDSPLERALARAWSEYALTVNSALFRYATALGDTGADADRSLLDHALGHIDTFLRDARGLSSANTAHLACAYLGFFIRADEIQAASGVQLLTERHAGLRALSAWALPRYDGRHPYVTAFRHGFRDFLQTAREPQGEVQHG